MPETPAVFLDRDGVINRRRADHVKCWDEFEFLPGVLQGLAELKAMDTRVVVVTNQGAVGRGLLSPEALYGIHARMLRAIDAAGGHVSAIYACLHAPQDGCACRKPQPTLFHRASAELGIALSQSIMVGDSPTDIQAARATGCRPVFVNDGRFPLDADVLGVNDLAGAVMVWRTMSIPVAAPPC